VNTELLFRPSKKIRRAAFILYAIALFTATHWPQLQLPSPVPRTDLWIHVTAFCAWALLLAWSELAGPFRSWRTVMSVGAIGVLYAALDEILQKTPGLNRVFGFDDMSANIAGAALATIIFALLTMLAIKKPAGPDSDDSAPERR